MPDAIDLSAPEVAAAIKAAVTEATEGLSTKNAELLKELKEAKKGKQVNPEDLEKLESQIETLQGDLSKAQSELKTAQKTAKEATEKLGSESAFTQKLLVENGLSAELLKANVTNPVHLKAVQAMLSGQVKIVAEGDIRKAVVGDKELSVFVKEWAAGDEGKHFVTAPNNSGGNSQGSNGSQVKGKTMQRSAFDAASQQERIAFAKEGGTVVD